MTWSTPNHIPSPYTAYVSSISVPVFAGSTPKGAMYCMFLLLSSLYSSIPTVFLLIPPILLSCSVCTFLATPFVDIACTVTLEQFYRFDDAIMPVLYILSMITTQDGCQYRLHLSLNSFRSIRFDIQRRRHGGDGDATPGPDDRLLVRYCCSTTGDTGTPWRRKYRREDEFELVRGRA